MSENKVALTNSFKLKKRIMLVRYGDTCSEFPDPPKVNQGWLSGEIDKDRKEREFPDPPEVIHGWYQARSIKVVKRVRSNL